MIVEIVGCKENEFEARIFFIFEQGNKSKWIVISSVLSLKEKIDQALKLNKTKECQSFNCSSLRNNLSYPKLQFLNLNETLNFEVRFERLISVNATNTATCEGSIGMLKYVMKKVASGGTELFAEVGQGSGKHNRTRYYWLGQAECARIKFGLMAIME